MSRLFTWALRLLPLLGIGLVIVGWKEWYPESWLDSKGFIINLASGLTTACFGVPIAVFGIQWLVQQRAREDELDTLRYLMNKNVADIARASFEMLANVMPGTLAEAVQVLRELQRALSAVIDYDQGQPESADVTLTPDPRTHVARLLRIACDYYFASTGETEFYTLGQSKLALMKWEVISSELLPRIEFLRSNSGIADGDIEEINTFLRGSNVVRVMSDYLDPDYATWIDLVFPAATNREEGYRVEYTALAELINITDDAAKELTNYAAYIDALRKAAGAVGVELQGMDKKAFDPSSVDTSPLTAS